jgi:hypothetical protein
MALLEAVIAAKNNDRGIGGQAALARELDVSDAVFSGIRRGDYNGDTDKYLQMVEDRYSIDSVDCPVLGAIPRTKCAHNCTRPFSATNPVRVRLYRACKTCDRRKS